MLLETHNSLQARTKVGALLQCYVHILFDWHTKKPKSLLKALRFVINFGNSWNGANSTLWNMNSRKTLQYLGSDNNSKAIISGFENSRCILSYVSAIISKV